MAGFVLAHLAAGEVTLALGDRVGGGGWLALHLVLLGAASNAIVVWSEHFAAALLHAAPVGERAATARALALNLGIPWRCSAGSTPAVPPWPRPGRAWSARSC